MVVAEEGEGVVNRETHTKLDNSAYLVRPITKL